MGSLHKYLEAGQYILGLVAISHLRWDKMQDSIAHQLGMDGWLKAVLKLQIPFSLFPLWDNWRAGTRDRVFPIVALWNKISGESHLSPQLRVFLHIHLSHRHFPLKGLGFLSVFRMLALLSGWKNTSLEVVLAPCKPLWFCKKKKNWK